MKKLLLILLLAVQTLAIHAQELNANVNVLSPNIQMTNKQVFTTLETAIRSFLNSYKWSNLQYEEEERIDCSFILTINSYSSNTFSGTIQVQYSRPIFNSDYNSPVINFIDNDLSFSYIENAPLEYQPNSHVNNLTSILAFYSYLILGADRNTMMPGGGDQYYKQMLDIVNVAQSDGSATGWRSFDGNKSRYWLSDNLNSPAFDPIKDCWYLYHRQGLDTMDDPNRHEQAKTTIRNSLIALQAVYQKRPNSALLNSFFDAKSDEIVSLFKEGPEMDINGLVNTLKQIDAGRTNKYETLIK